MRVVYEFDKVRLKKLMKRVEALGKKKNKVLKPAVKAGVVRLAKEIRKRIPAYPPNRKSKAYVIKKGERRRSRLWEAKKAVGSSAKVSKSAKNRGGIEGKAGSGVGKPRARSVDRPRQPRDFGRKGVGMGAGNLHWYLAGTRPRRTRTGVFTGRMRKPRLVQRVEAQYGQLAQLIVEQKIRSGLKKEWLKSKR